MSLSPLMISVFRDKPYFFAAFTPRLQYKGRPIIYELFKYAGVVLKCRYGWEMEDDDPYPGEHAIISARGKPLLLDRQWIASGDLTLFMAPPSFNLLYDHQ